MRNLQKISMNKDTVAGNSKACKACLVNIELTGSSLAYLIFVQIRKRYSFEQVQPQICSASQECRLNFSSLIPMLLHNTQTVLSFATAVGEWSHIVEMQSPGRIALGYKYGKTYYRSPCRES